MGSRPEMSLGMQRTESAVVLTDRACDTCPACAAGARMWCLTPAAVGRELTPELPADQAPAIADALLAAAALAEAPATATVLLLADPDGAVARLVRALAAGRVVVAPEPGLARAELAAEPTGRAPVVIAGADVRAAVRAVRRGGHVCVAGPVESLPSVTELVQREVTLISPQDAAAPARRVPPSLWASLAAA